MGRTIIEKIISRSCGRDVKPGEIADVEIDVRVARDFGGANVVKNLEDRSLPIADPKKTFFTFDCNPCGSDQKYAANQQKCRVFARNHGIRLYDIDAGIGTHLAIDDGLIGPGGTLVSTDSHANLLGAIGAFGQGMGDQDVAHAFAFGKTWFEVPKSMKVVLKGRPGPRATAKDVALALLKRFGANGLLDYSAELYGDYIDALTLDQRITISSLATEMGAIILLIPPSADIIRYCQASAEPVFADSDAHYDQAVELDISGLEPLISRPGHPEDVVKVSEVAGRKIDSCFIGSCTNGRIEDLRAAAEVLKNRKTAPGVVLKVVPATDRIWQEALKTGLVEVFKHAGALLGNAGCAGCAAGQIGQNGPGEVTISTGNRNFAGKQGCGEVYLASPATVAACAVAGVITTADRIPAEPATCASRVIAGGESKLEPAAPAVRTGKPARVRGRVWVIRQDNIDTDMIYHNRYLTVTKLAEMGQYTFGNLKGWEDFAQRAKPGDVIITGKNFGAGSSRQQAVDCFKSLGIAAIVAQSFGAIYKRNAINAGLPIVIADLSKVNLKDGDEIEANFETGQVTILPAGTRVNGRPFSEVQMSIYRRGGLLAR
jgi:3-isopropylmalate/(R)-2-methylmalate dehydratase large subunit